MYKTLTVKINGVKPLMVRNVQLANPLNPIVKLIKSYSGKRKKTDEDLEVLSQLEWVGGLYTSESFQDIQVSNGIVTPVGGGNCILPAAGIEAALVSAAKKFKLGTTFKSAILIDEDPEINFAGKSKEIADLVRNPNYIDIRAVTVNRVKIMRTRPIFPDWSISFELQYLPDQISKQQIKDVLDIGGRVVGMFEYRPRFGSYSYELNQF